MSAVSCSSLFIKILTILFLETFYKISLLNRLYAESRNEEGDAETKVETADKTVETCRKALEDAENEAKNARDELDEKKKWRRRIQTLFMTSYEMKQDNADLGRFKNKIEFVLKFSIRK